MSIMSIISMISIIPFEKSMQQNITILNILNKCWKIQSLQQNITTLNILNRCCQIQSLQQNVTILNRCWEIQSLYQNITISNLALLHGNFLFWMFQHLNFFKEIWKTTISFVRYFLFININGKPFFQISHIRNKNISRIFHFELFEKLIWSIPSKTTKT